MSSHRGQATAAFTLVELMIALVIMGVMAAAIAPSLSEVLADSREGAASQDLVRLSRRARAMALSTGMAHLLRFQEASKYSDQTLNSLGSIELYAGMNGRCTQTPWTTAFAATLAFPSPADPGPAGRLRAIEIFEMAYYNVTGDGERPTAADTGRQVITLRATVGAGTDDKPIVWICYQPNGDSYTMVDSPADPLKLFRQSTLDEPQHVRGSVVFTIRRAVRTGSVVPHGTDRKVIFPAGGNARAQ
jgi:prepilin-type N-terminal cleavage/methylation domain-containing protein